MKSIGSISAVIIHVFISFSVVYVYGLSYVPIVNNNILSSVFDIIIVKLVN